MIGNVVLSGASGGPFAKFSNEVLRLAPLKKKTMLLPDQANAPRYLFELNISLADEAKINVLRGLLALEAGKLEQAQDLFVAALRFWHSPAGLLFTDDPEAHSSRLIAHQYLRLLLEANP